MAKRATTKCNLSLNLGLLVLLNFLGTAMLEDVHSLSCNLIIRSPTKAEPLWYEGQCSMDGIDFLSSNNVNKTMPLGNQEKMANATEVWTCLTQWIDRWKQELRDKVSEIKVHTTKTSGHPTLRVTMLSKHSHEQIIGASWEFNTSENYSFILDLKTMKWKLINPVPGDIMKEWKDDETLMKHLNLSIAECSKKFNEFLNQHEERTTAPSGFLGHRVKKQNNQSQVKVRSGGLKQRAVPEVEKVSKVKRSPRLQLK
ncbi:retinoic acid early-inducible protein 1-gamma-like [Rattus norvegicus]|uniref:retinoic acid early-inducible protein 1-gamma-like n=1 Tax=Rattus norvegicus TaxID=10116 RepID=UPI002FD8087C